MKGIRIRLTIREWLLMAGILVALAAIFLYWREMLPVDRAFASPSGGDIILREAQQLFSGTFSLLR